MAETVAVGMPLIDASSMNPPEDHEIRLVLVGKTGAGKSATGNTIIGEKKFKASARGISINIGCQHERVVRFGKNLLVIDTPGVFDTSKPQVEIAAEVSKFLIVSAPGPHAIILVTSAAWRFTAEEIDCVRTLKDMFGEDLVRYLFLVITRTEDWKDDNITCKSFLSDLPEEAKCVLKECIEANKVVAFQNSLRGENGEQQVSDLLNKVSDHIVVNEGRYYSEKNWEDAERAVQERIKQIMEEERKKTEKRQQDINEQIRQEMNEKLQRIADQQQKENDAWEQNFREVQDSMQKEMEDLIKEESNRLKKLGHEGNNKETSGEREKTQAPPESPSKAPRTQSIEKEVMETPAPCHDGASQVTLTTRKQHLSHQAGIGEPLDGAILRELSEQRRQEKQQTERILEDFKKTISHVQADATAQQEKIGLLHKKMEESKQVLLESFRREREERERKYTMERKEIEQAHERKKKEDEIRFRQMLEMEARDRARKEAAHKPFFPFPEFQCAVM